MIKKIIILLVCGFLGFLIYQSLLPTIILNSVNVDKKDGSPLDAEVGTVYIVPEKVQEQLMEAQYKKIENDPHRDYIKGNPSWETIGMGGYKDSYYSNSTLSIDTILNRDLSIKLNELFAGTVYVKNPDSFMDKNSVLVIENGEEQFYEKASEYLAISALYEKYKLSWADINQNMITATNDDISFNSYYNYEIPLFQDDLIYNIKQSFPIVENANPFYMRYNLEFSDHSLNFSNYGKNIERHYTAEKKIMKKYVKDNFMYKPSNNYISELTEEYVAFAPSKITKFENNTFLININTDSYISDGLSLRIISEIHSKLGNVFKQYFEASDFHLYVSVNNDWVSNGMYMENGALCADTTFLTLENPIPNKSTLIDDIRIEAQQDWRNYPFYNGWIPNEFASKIISSYFTVMAACFEYNEPFNPLSAFEDVAVEHNITTQEVGNYVLNYVTNYKISAYYGTIPQ